MNFYKRFIGDIQAKTGNLSLAEFGAYDRLLDHYYSTEVAIPADMDECYRICRAMSKDERKAVDKVVARFFELTETGYVQHKAAEQIAATLPLIEAARTNGKKGGRPRKPKTDKEPTGFLNKTQSEPRAKASQSQISTSLRSVDNGDLAEAFDEVWRAYPKRPGASRADALKAWTARQREGVPREVMLEGVKRYAAYCLADGTEPRYIKQPATFFGPSEHYLADWTYTKPATKAAPQQAEPAWRTEQRLRTQIAAPGVAVQDGKDAADFFVEVEANDVTTRALG